MLRPSPSSQKKIEDVFHSAGYAVRYEKGNFNSGFCLLESKKVVVINKFHSLEAKVNTLIEILGMVNLSTENMNDEELKLYRELTTRQEELFSQKAA